MFGCILKATNSSFQKGMTFCRSVYVKKVMKLLAFIFEQPSYITSANALVNYCFICSHNMRSFAKIKPSRKFPNLQGQKSRINLF